jgi:Ca2+-binding RTX toxin-like protein
MAVVTVTDDAVNCLSVEQFIDPDAALDSTSATAVRLSSEDGYDLVLRGSGFTFDAQDAPTAGVITGVFLYNPVGELVGQVDGISTSLETYYDEVAVGNHVHSWVSDLLAGADTLSGGAADDDLVGYAGNDRLYGFGGDDRLDGGAGNDRVYGGTGADLIYGWTGNDRLYGESGNDRLYGESGNDSISAGSGNDVVEGDAGNDAINGGSGADRLGGGDGADRIVGGTGRDVIYGDAGNDRLAGGSNHDTIDGGSGDDRISGGSGNDRLTGGSGADVFVFASVAEGGDRITDFRHGTDHLEFAAAGFANLNANFSLVVNDDPHATAAAGSFLFDTSSHRLYYDADGSGAGAEAFIATLEHVSTLSKGDFLIA